MLGESVLVAPVLDPGRNTVGVYLPNIGESWIHLWSNTPFEIGWNTVIAPLGQPGIFIRESHFKTKESLGPLISFSSFVPPVVDSSQLGCWHL